MRREIALSAAHSATFLASSPIAFVEIRAGLARARFTENPPRLNEEEYSRAIRDVAADWGGYFQVDISESLITLAGDLAEKHPLRAYDALHLASALNLRDLAVEDVSVSKWDRDLADASGMKDFL
jgi:predicted nucleic acid-binding protein